MLTQKRQIDYVVICINEFAEKHSLKTKEAFKYLFQYKGIEFLKENYDIEHTLSINDALEDMYVICKKNGGNL